MPALPELVMISPSLTLCSELSLEKITRFLSAYFAEPVSTPVSPVALSTAPIPVCGESTVETFAV